MELSEFITESLKGIIKGVKESQDFANTSGGRINPIYTNNYNSDNSKNKYIRIEHKEDYTIISEINFDIAVTASDKKESGASGGINVLSLNLGGKIQGGEFNETVSRIKFTICAALPSTLPYIPA